MISQIVKRVVNCCGIDIRLIRNIRRSSAERWSSKQVELWKPFIAHHNIQTVVDVGGNTGQFASLMYRHFPESRVISFEPLELCHGELGEVINRFPSSRIVKAAAGSENSTVTINVSEFSPCTSLLPGTDLLGEDYPAAAVIEEVEVPIVRIDDELKNEDLLGGTLIKFDVQGYELQAIEGAIETLDKASVVICEVSFFRRLYKGQPLFDDIYRALHARGFTFMGCVEQSSRKSDGRIVEADAVFQKKELKG